MQRIYAKNLSELRQVTFNLSIQWCAQIVANATGKTAGVVEEADSFQTQRSYQITSATTRLRIHSWWTVKQTLAVNEKRTIVFLFQAQNAKHKACHETRSDSMS